MCVRAAEDYLIYCVDLHYLPQSVTVGGFCKLDYLF